MSEIDLTPAYFVRYDEHGAVTEWGHMAAGEIAALQGKGDRILAQQGDDSSYVCPKRLRVKHKTPNPTVLDGLTLRHVPANSTIKIEDIGPRIPDRSQHKAGGTVELSFDYPGLYRVEIVSPRHLSTVFEVQA